MNVYSRTLSLPGAAQPVRERGASALDRVIAQWPAPDPASMVIDPWGAPVGPAVVRSGPATWSAPDPVMRFDLPAPDLHRSLAPIELPAPRVDLVEPRHRVAAPDLHVARRAAFAPPSGPALSTQAWPPPALADLVTVDTTEAVEADRSGIAPRLIVGLAAAAGAIAVGAAALLSLF